MPKIKKVSSLKQEKSSNKSTKPSKESTKIEVEGIAEDVQLENDTNMLIFTKNETKDEQPAAPVKKRLSRKERIRLEKVVERKEKTSRVNKQFPFP